MTWHTDDRALYWQQRALDDQQAEAAKKIGEYHKEIREQYPVTMDALEQAEKREQAIRESVYETIRRLGIDALKRLSWFPRNRRTDRES